MKQLIHIKVSLLLMALTLGQLALAQELYFERGLNTSSLIYENTDGINPFLNTVGAMPASQFSAGIRFGSPVETMDNFSDDIQSSSNRIHLKGLVGTTFKKFEIKDSYFLDEEETFVDYNLSHASLDAGFQLMINLSDPGSNRKPWSVGFNSAFHVSKLIQGRQFNDQKFSELNDDPLFKGFTLFTSYGLSIERQLSKRTAMYIKWNQATSLAREEGSKALQNLESLKLKSNSLTLGLAFSLHQNAISSGKHADMDRHRKAQEEIEDLNRRNIELEQRVRKIENQEAKSQRSIDVNPTPQESAVSGSQVSVFFDVDSSILKKKSKSTLKRLVDDLNTNHQKTIKIIGHTGNTDDDNLLELATDRAIASYQYMVDKGLSANRCRIVGANKTNTSNDYRVDIIID